MKYYLFKNKKDALKDIVFVLLAVAFNIFLLILSYLFFVNKISPYFNTSIIFDGAIIFLAIFNTSIILAWTIIFLAMFIKKTSNFFLGEPSLILSEKGFKNTEVLLFNEVNWEDLSEIHLVIDFNRIFIKYTYKDSFNHPKIIRNLPFYSLNKVSSIGYLTDSLELRFKLKDFFTQYRSI